MSGSSPRLWGTPIRVRRFRFFPRFIPTPVGNTGPSKSSAPLSSVHPHACGEHSRVSIMTKICNGSSPRLWGTRVVGAPRHNLKRRFIPTPVGNTSSPRTCPLAVHGSSPRLWGTLSSLPLTVLRLRFIPTPVGNTAREAGVTNNGSSPRLWGTQQDKRHYIIFYSVHPHACGEHPYRPASQINASWFIPTPVGNTRRRMISRLIYTVHPHACGEHRRRAADLDRESGSSPRLWGTLFVASGVTTHVRFIPTPVGNTQAVSSTSLPAPVHPHACGEHVM